MMVGGLLPDLEGEVGLELKEGDGISGRVAPKVDYRYGARSPPPNLKSKYKVPRDPP